MKSPTTLLVALTMGAVLTVASAPASAFQSTVTRCQDAIAKETTTFFAGLLKLDSRCREAEIEAPGSCVAPDPGVIAQLEAKLTRGVARRCDVPSLRQLGFPGPCYDLNLDDGFTLADLGSCLTVTHEYGATLVTALLVDPATTGPLGDGSLKCQEAVDKAGVRFARLLLPTVQKCRKRLLDDAIRNALEGVSAIPIQPRNCAIEEPKTAARIAKLEHQVRTAIGGACTPSDVLALHFCEPDQTTVGDTAECLIGAIRRKIDDPVLTDPPDLIDYEYAESRVCGDNRRNQTAEECDGIDDAACPGQCGAPDGFFPCLCQNVPRQRVIEHADADLDLGWAGILHDQQVVEGGGYVADLWDCDGVGDVDCIVGPSCSLSPHAPCGVAFGAPLMTGDALCAGLGQGNCRKTAGAATGPHCDRDVQRACRFDGDCPAVDDRCVYVAHSAPMPLAAGGVSLCVENIFTEDVVGTINLATGAGAVRARERLRMDFGATLNLPCPVCGGFCAALPGSPCTDDSQCPGSVCVLDAVCNGGRNAGQPCRPNPPFGGPTALFGNPSVDCPPPSSDSVNIDLLVNPETTGTSTLMATVPCASTAFAGSRCVQGANDGRPCGVAADCPGGACHPQCFCPNETRPNACGAACVGGPQDAAACASDSECPSGFCHAGDCRLNATDHDSVQEGRCTVPTSNAGACSAHAFVVCGQDADCVPPHCPFCDPGETCVAGAGTAGQCFVNGEIVRQGAPGTTERVTASTFCLPAAGLPTDVVLGFPGPGALTQPETTIAVGF